MKNMFLHRHYQMPTRNFIYIFTKGQPAQDLTVSTQMVLRVTQCSGMNPVTFPAGIGAPMMSTCWPPAAARSPMSIVGIGAVLLRSENVSVFFQNFYYPICLHPCTAQYSSVGGVIPLNFASFPFGGAVGCPLDSTGVGLCERLPEGHGQWM
jgi:hypothetical protein